MVQPQTDLVRHWPHFSECGKSYFVPYKDPRLARSCFSPGPTINIMVVGPNNKYKKVNLFMQADIFKLLINLNTVGSLLTPRLDAS